VWVSELSGENLPECGRHLKLANRGCNRTWKMEKHIYLSLYLYLSSPLHLCVWVHMHASLLLLGFSRERANQKNTYFIFHFYICMYKIHEIFSLYTHTHTHIYIKYFFSLICFSLEIPNYTYRYTHTHTHTPLENPDPIWLLLQSAMCMLSQIIFETGSVNTHKRHLGRAAVQLVQGRSRCRHGSLISMVLSAYGEHGWPP
jgi:hypothetical protein